ncbi:hypothetical protein EP331_13055 [bacterium]|nr:MAG: hypothetical protein EP331_13055 [bacterium]
MKIKLLLIIALVFTLQSTFAQTKETKLEYGLAASIQSGQSEVSLPLWLKSNIQLLPSLAFFGTNDNGFEYALGLKAKKFKNERSTGLNPYSAAGLTLYQIVPKNGDSLVDIALDLGIGADYFFTKNVALGVEAQFYIASSDDLSPRFGNPGGFSFGTATQASIYIFF